MPEFREQSDFNDAIGTVGRMNGLLYVCDQTSGDLDVHSWYFKGLLPFSRELSDDMKDKEKEKVKEFKEIIDPELNIFMKNANRGKQEVPCKLYNLLNDFENFLRDVWRKAGYKTKMKDDPRFAR